MKDSPEASAHRACVPPSSLKEHESYRDMAGCCGVLWQTSDLAVYVMQNTPLRLFAGATNSVCVCALLSARLVFFMYNRNNCAADIFDLAPWLLIEHNHLYRIMCITGKGQEQLIGNYK